MVPSAVLVCGLIWIPENIKAAMGHGHQEKGRRNCGMNSSVGVQEEEVDPKHGL